MLSATEKGAAAKLVDLHVHTHCSDGTFSPSEVVRMARRRNLRALAITDHDTVNGVEEALAEGKRSEIEVIAGVEISVRYKKGEIHILGYDIDWNNHALVESLAELRRGREERNPEIVARLRGFGFDIDYSEVKEVAGAATVGRPHIAQVLIKKGYVANIAEAFDRYLAEGAPAFVPRTTLATAKAIRLIRGAGGTPVLAHPFRMSGDRQEVEGLVAKLADEGLMGIEVYSSAHGPGDVEACAALAKRYGLLVTGGSDFHGKNKPGIELGLGNGFSGVPYHLVENMRKRTEPSRAAQEP